MEVGDYVRTKNGSIFKIIDGNEDNWGLDILVGYLETFEENWLELYRYNDNGSFFNDNNIVKSSPNIIDLIELGDLVRLFMEDNLDKEDTDIFEVIAITDDKKEIGVFTSNFEIEFFPIENLRGIVTWEMFESMEYKVD